MALYELAVMDQDWSGGPVATLANCNVVSVVKELNVGHTIGFTYPKKDPAGGAGQHAEVQLVGRECQVLRDGDVYAGGVLMNRRTGSGRADFEVTAEPFSWWLKKRRIGTTPTNLVVNPSFVTNTSGWTANGVTATRVTGQPFRYGTGIELVQATTWVDTHVSQVFTGVAGGDIGLLLVVAAWFRITDWVGPAILSRGLFVEGLTAGTATFRTSSTFEIDDSTDPGASGTPIRAETSIWVPPGETWDIDIRLYGPNGTVPWSDVQVVAMESVAVPPGGEDITSIAERVIDHIQLKGDLGWGTDCPASGVELYFPKAWQYIDRFPADRVIGGELAPLGFDWSIEPAATTKTFTTHSPTKGTDRSGTVTLLYRPGDPLSNIASHSFVEDGNGAVTDWTVQGDGDGPDREEGHIVDTSDLDGQVLEDVLAAPPGVTLSMLDPLAESRLARSKTIVELPEVLTFQGQGDLVGLLEDGDLVHVTIDDDGCQFDGDLRIFRLENTCRTETLKIALGPTGKNLPPTVEQLVERLLWRIEDKERSAKALKRPVTEEVAPFSKPGAVTVDDDPRGVWTVQTGGQIVGVTLGYALGFPDTADVDVEIFLSGASIGVATIPAGENRELVYLGNFRAGPGDGLQVQCVDAGDGVGMDLTVMIRMKG